MSFHHTVKRACIRMKQVHVDAEYNSSIISEMANSVTPHLPSWRTGGTCRTEHPILPEKADWRAVAVSGNMAGSHMGWGEVRCVTIYGNLSARTWLRYGVQHHACETSQRYNRCAHRAMVQFTSVQPVGEVRMLIRSKRARRHRRNRSSTMGFGGDEWNGRWASSVGWSMPLSCHAAPMSQLCLFPEMVGDWQCVDWFYGPVCGAEGIIFPCRTAAPGLPAFQPFSPLRLPPTAPQSLGTWHGEVLLILVMKKKKKKICWIIQMEGTGICSMTRTYLAPCMIPRHVGGHHNAATGWLRRSPIFPNRRLLR